MAPAGGSASPAEAAARGMGPRPAKENLRLQLKLLRQVKAVPLKCG